MASRDISREIEDRLRYIIGENLYDDFIYKLRDRLTIINDNFLIEELENLRIKQPLIFKNWIRNWREKVGTNITFSYKDGWLYEFMDKFIQEYQIESFGRQKYLNKAPANTYGNANVGTKLNRVSNNPKKVDNFKITSLGGLGGKLLAKKRIFDHGLELNDEHIVSVFGCHDAIESRIFDSAHYLVHQECHNKYRHDEKDGRIYAVCEILLFKINGHYQIKVVETDDVRCRNHEFKLSGSLDSHTFPNFIRQIIHIFLKTIIFGQKNYDQILDSGFAIHSYFQLYLNRTSPGGNLHTDAISGEWYPDVISLHYKNDGLPVKGAFMTSKECILEYLKAANEGTYKAPCKALMTNIPAGGSIVFRQNTYHATPMMAQEELTRLSDWINRNLDSAKKQLIDTFTKDEPDSFLTRLLGNNIQAKERISRLIKYIITNSTNAQDLSNRLELMSQFKGGLVDGLNGKFPPLVINDANLSMLFGREYRTLIQTLGEVQINNLKRKFYIIQAVAVLNYLKSETEGDDITVSLNKTELLQRFGISPEQIRDSYDIKIDTSGIHTTTGADADLPRSFFRQWITIVDSTGIGVNSDIGMSSDLSYNWSDFFRPESNIDISSISRSRNLRELAKEFDKLLLGVNNRHYWSFTPDNIDAADWNKFVDKVTKDMAGGSSKRKIRKIKTNKTRKTNKRKNKKWNSLKTSNKNNNNKKTRD